MLDILIQIIVFLIKTAIIVAGILAVIFGIASVICKDKLREKTKVTINKLNEYYEEIADLLQKEILGKDEYKKIKKERKREKKVKKEKKECRKRLFIIDFEGDMKASGVGSLREEITAILNVIKPQDEIIVRLESCGGLVHGYGLAASQLKRIRDRGIKLTVAVDKVAASGGYMMACVADQILAAPFAIIGSIGVIAQLPNFNRFLKKHDVDFEQVMGGEYKRTLSLFGENTKEARKKFQEEVDETHGLFKDFVKQNRAQIDIEKLSTGEHWLGTKALELNLVDKLITSDDYLLQFTKIADLYEIHYHKKKKIYEKIASTIKLTIKKIMSIFREDQDMDYWM